MQIQMNFVLCDPLSGDPLRNTLAFNPQMPNLSEMIREAPFMRLRDPIIHALLNSTMPQDVGASGQEKMDRFILAQRCMNDSVELTAEDVARIKEITGRLYLPLLVGTIWSCIDPATVPADLKRIN